MKIEDIAVRPPSDPCWQFPVGLHGNRRETKLFATRLVAKALKTGDFAGELAQCEFRSVLDDSDLIYVSERSRLESPGDTMWRVTSVRTAIVSALQNSEQKLDSFRKFQPKWLGGIVERIKTGAMLMSR